MSTTQILDVWIFGDVWCRGWLVTDVWISTASILNLCAISVDRYVAVTRPVKYRSIMTPRKAKTIVAGVWIVSFLICCPPLLPPWTLSQQSAFTPEVDRPAAKRELSPAWLGGTSALRVKRQSSQAHDDELSLSRRGDAKMNAIEVKGEPGSLQMQRSDID